MALLDVRNLTTSFHLRSGIVRAAQNISLSLNRGETLGIVGESGSGKSVTCYSIMRLIPQPPGRIESGEVMFDGQDLLTLSESEMRQIRGTKISMIFQDPMTSLNPYLRISTQMVEAIRVHEQMDEKDALRKAITALEEVGIPDASKRVLSYPHEFSGGMRQRVMIAMALINDPDLLIADEPTTALDVTVQARVLDIIKERQERLGTAVILVTHDLGVVAGTCDKVQVMYAGQVVESGTTDQVFYDPQHAYTRSLQKAIPSLKQKEEVLYTIAGTPPDLSKPVAGCAFYPRCPFPKIAKPDGAPPELIELKDGHCVRDCGFCDRRKPIEEVLAKEVAEDAQ
ncbi:MAG: ABC transporter ATP-binding protein [Pseudomonadota bacterium]